MFEYFAGSEIWLLDTLTTDLGGNVRFYSANMVTGFAGSHDLNGDGVTDAADADFLLEYVVGNEAALHADGDLSGDGRIDSYDAHLLLTSLSGDAVTVPAGESAQVRVSIELTGEARAELDVETPKGTYVEAYVYARSEGGTEHSIPVLAFYGDWSEPSMFDRGTLMDLVSLTSNVAPYLYQAIGPSADAYVDLAPAPGAPKPSLMAVFGGNVLHVDAETGDYYNWYYMFSNNLVALAYVGTQEYKMGSWDTMVDWYFIIDRLGYVYLMGFLEQDGKYYYLEHDILAPKGIYTKLDFEMDTKYFGSAYFDGEMLYYSAYKESEDNVTLMAIDVAGGSKVCYELGTFADGVWPVAGLMELGEVKNHIGVIMGGNACETMSQPAPVEQQSFRKGQGSLNGAAAPMSVPDVKQDLVNVDVTLPETAANAEITVSFDARLLELTAVDGSADAFAWKAESGEVRLALADAQMISRTDKAARLTFRVLGGGETTVSIATERLGDHASGHVEQITLTLETEKPRENPFVDVKDGDFFLEPVRWAVEKNITTGVSSDRFDPHGVCVRGQVVTFLWRAMGKPGHTIENPFVDVKEEDFFCDAVLWAYENGITTGIDSTHFDPNGSCSRAQVVTFLWRTMGRPASSAEVTFTDVKPGEFYYDAVAWAVENDITTGLDSSTFGVLNPCNRAQVVTFLYRTFA